jgi:AcrR family transcriptional regulator
VSRAVLVAVAGDIADDTGWDRLTLAAVADRVGVRLPSLYKHIESLDGLRRDVCVAAVEDLAATLSAAAVGKAGADALRSVAVAYRDFARRHPGRYAATVRAPASGDTEHTAAADSVLRIVFAVLAGYGLTGTAAVDAARALRSALHGFVALETAGGFGLPRGVDRSFGRLVAGLDAALRAGSW